MEDFLTFDLTQKVLLSVQFPKLTSQHHFRSYKIMPRYQVALHCGDIMYYYYMYIYVY